MAKILKIPHREASLKRKIRKHLRALGFIKGPDGTLMPPDDKKETIRALHSAQKKQKIIKNVNFISSRYSLFAQYFASGKEVVPHLIKPRIELVESSSPMNDLFRLAALTWSVPVSSGFGRRMRYLVWDDSNRKLIGIIGLTDPVFNLQKRDEAIGWSAKDRESRLVNVMDAFVMGAVPPYNSLLCGKLIPCLLKTNEVYKDFLNKYGESRGIISGEKKLARLLAITTSSSMGRSSVYNRLRIDGISYFSPVGYTGGWGHFHIPDELFSEMRDYLRSIRHPYADLHDYGQGPNWRIRTIRACLANIGMKDDLLKHGIKREVFLCEIAKNSLPILRSGRGKPNIVDLESVATVSEKAIKRWVIPRAIRKNDYLDWDSRQILDLILGGSPEDFSRNLDLLKNA